MSDHTHDSELLSNALRYFLDYIRFDTAADPKSDSNPSTPKILVLAAKIAEDLRELGLEADVDEFGYLYSSIPATAEARYTLGLIAHMDTSPDFSGADLRARRIRYDGGDIILAHGVCTHEAADKAIPLERHASHLLVHGTLHLLGYDHMDEAAAADMESREARALARLGIADPYADEAV